MELDGMYLIGFYEVGSPVTGWHMVRYQVKNVSMLHYVQSSGRYALIISSDEEREDKAYEYFVTLNWPVKRMRSEQPHLGAMSSEREDIYESVALRFLPLGSDDNVFSNSEAYRKNKQLKQFKDDY
ncbi:unnamed protein product, partial [Gongylonema pulchrum]|uniref:FERM domain-containing protein n=1 Tax=Gongylonema pulchrum TaxID=637853 RepID=A0A183DFF7_9BILA